MALTSNQGIPSGCPLDSDAFRQLVQRVYMANEQCFDCPLIKFDLAASINVTVSLEHTVMDACSTENMLAMFLNKCQSSVLLEGSAYTHLRAHSGGRPVPQYRMRGSGHERGRAGG